MDTAQSPSVREPGLDVSRTGTQEGSHNVNRELATAPRSCALEVESEPITSLPAALLL